MLHVTLLVATKSDYGFGGSKLWQKIGTSHNRNYTGQL
jgi:hypothetical protein